MLATLVAELAITWASAGGGLLVTLAAVLSGTYGAVSQMVAALSECLCRVRVVSVLCLHSCLCLRMNVVSFLPTLSFAQYPAQRLLTASPNRFFYKLDGTRG